MERGLLTSRGIVTHNFSLNEWEAAFGIANSFDSIKVLLKPGRSA
jgi:L-iditol 2-dehydrogenase